MNTKKQKFELSRVSGSPVSDEELLRDLRLVAEEVKRNTVPLRVYRKHGKYSDATLGCRFGSWNAALEKAGLELSNEVWISDERLFENLLKLWEHFGRQPRRRELALSPSVISQGPYKRRFGSWGATLKSFVDYANSAGSEPETGFSPPSSTKRTGRDPSFRLRYQVLNRDGFACKNCGASPAKTAGVELHIDHIVPWSRGGETTLENLQTLCSGCNLGKSNL